MKQLFLLLLFVACLSCKKDQLIPEIEEKATVFNGTSDMSFANEKVGFISGGIPYENAEAAVIAKTTDGGATWQTIPVYIGSNPSSVIRSIFAKSADSVYATYHARRDDWGVCFSKDGGNTWAKLGNFDVNCAYSGIYFKSSLVGFVCNSDILQTKDGGKSWTTVYDYSGFAGIGRLFFTSDKVGYAYGGYVSDYSSCGTLVKTTDGGNTWTELTSMREFVTEFSFINDSIGYAFTFNQNIYKTTDGGHTWELLKKITGLGSLYCSAAVKGKNKYIGAGEHIYKSTDDFKTVTKIYSSPVYSANFCVKAIQISESCIFFLSSTGTVIKINPHN